MGWPLGWVAASRFGWGHGLAAGLGRCVEVWVGMGWVTALSHTVEALGEDMGWATRLGHSAGPLGWATRLGHSAGPLGQGAGLR
jgi:hypothetical protein